MKRKRKLKTSETTFVRELIKYPKKLMNEESKRLYGQNRMVAIGKRIIRSKGNINSKKKNAARENRANKKYKYKKGVVLCMKKEKGKRT